ncbi:MAG: hypothetical protein AB4063_21260 [Crocosphaera sp.]
MKYQLTLDYPSTLLDRNSWSKGKWSSEHDVYIWVDFETDYDCLIVRLRLGYLSGYVGINNQHPLYGKSASDEIVAALKIHGNSIFSEKQIMDRGEDYLQSIPLVSKERAEPTWWIGMACCHKLDLIPYLFSMSGTIKEGESYKDIEYVTREVTALSRQLKVIETHKTYV